MATHDEAAAAASAHSSPSLRATVLFTDLPADMTAIYKSVLSRLTHNNNKNNNNNNKRPRLHNNDHNTSSNSKHDDRNVDVSSLVLLDDADGATMAVTVRNRAAAQQLYKRLQNRSVCGRRWKVQFMPQRATLCSKQACLVDCVTVPATSPALVDRALSVVPGYLSLVQHDEAKLQQENEEQDIGTKQRAHTQKRAKGHGSDATVQDAATATAALVDGDDMGGRGDVRARHLASFVDEGSALHARAVLSGRLIGSSGVHLFIERRR